MCCVAFFVALISCLLGCFLLSDVRLLISDKYGANCPHGGVNLYEMTAIIAFAKMDKLSYVINQSSGCEDINKLWHTPGGLIHIAARYGQNDVVRFLLENGADVNLSRDDGQTPLILALDNDHVETALYLLNHNADPTAKSISVFTALSLASARGLLPVVMYLTMLDAIDTDFVPPESPERYTALHYAIMNNQAGVVEYLCNLPTHKRPNVFAMAYIHYNQGIQISMNALHLAAACTRCTDPRIFEALIKVGAMLIVSENEDVVVPYLYAMVSKNQTALHALDNHKEF